MGDEKQSSYFPEKEGQKSRFWRRKIRDREEYSITMQHAVTAHNEKTHYSNIRNYLFEFRTEIFHFAKVDFVSMLPTNIAISREPIVHLQWDLCWIYDVPQMESWIWQIYQYLHQSKVTVEHVDPVNFRPGTGFQKFSIIYNFFEENTTIDEIKVMAHI